MGGEYSPLASFLLPLRAFAPFRKIPLDGGVLFSSGKGGNKAAVSGMDYFFLFFSFFLK